VSDQTDAPARSISVPRSLVLAGLSLTPAGILSYFQLERHGFVTTTDFLFSFLDHVFLPILVIGLGMTFAGSVMWALRAAAGNVALIGLGILILSPSILEVIPINIHGWTAAFLFVGADAMLIGVLFLVLAAIRAFNNDQRKSTPSMRRPVRVKSIFSPFLLSLPSEPGRLCRHPSIRTLC
jgi:hypothetical protein